MKHVPRWNVSWWYGYKLSQQGKRSPLTHKQAPDTMNDTEKAFAIFTDNNGHRNLLQYTTCAKNADEAMEIFADDVMSTDRSVEANWEWHVTEIPTDLVGLDVPEEEVYAYTDDLGSTTLVTPPPSDA